MAVLIMFVPKLFATLILLGVCSYECSRTDNLGKDCRVMQVPMNTHEFDLNTLHRTRDYRIVVTEFEQVFLINICGSLTKQCNGQNNVSVCLISKSGVEKVIGYTNNSVIYDDGRLQFVLQGEKCQGKSNYTVTVIMMCDTHGDKGPELVPASLSDCTYFFIWYNNISCTPRKLIDCHVLDSLGVVYDLSRLTLYNSNYKAIHKNNIGPYVMYHLNVCQSVVMVHGVTCPFNSGTCATAAGNNTHVRNLGDVTNGPYFENGVLKLKYEGGDLCTDKTSVSLRSSTIIQFICDKDQHESNPKFHRVTHSCEYHFTWRTSAACRSGSWNAGHFSSQPSLHISGAEDCAVVNPRTGTRLDLRPLRGKEYGVNGDNGLKLKLGVCGPLVNSSCGTNAGACVQQPTTNESFSIGQSNSNLELQFEETPLYLYYSNGSSCIVIKNQTWNTRIVFECGTQDMVTSYAAFGCEYNIFFQTGLACDKKEVPIPCVATNGDRIVDLSSFASKTSNYNITTGTDDFFINICRQIIPLKEEDCPRRSGACILGNHFPMSLGYFVSPPVIDELGNTVLTYINGSKCPHHSDVKLSSVFRFICDITAGFGNPTFKEVKNDCIYHFDWLTSIVCEEEEEEFDVTATGCLIHDRASHVTADLTSLRRTGGHLVSDMSGKNFTINMCGSNDTCDGAVICEELTDSWVSYGQLVSVVHDFSEEMTKMYYNKGAPCDATGKSLNSAEMWLKCVADAGIGEPVVLESESCFVLFEWQTSAACGKISVDPGKKQGGKPRDHKMGVRFGIISVALIVVFVFFLLWMNRMLPKCPSLKSSCCSWLKYRIPSNDVYYSRQRSNEEDFCTLEDNGQT